MDWIPKLAKNFVSCGMLIRPIQVDALPGQLTTPTDMASHLYQHSQIPTPIPLYNKCTLHTPPPFLFLCLFHPRGTPSLPIILAIKLWQPSPWLYILTPLFPLELTLLRCSLSFVQRLLDTQEPSCNMRTMGPPPCGTRAECFSEIIQLFSNMILRKPGNNKYYIV